MSMMWCALLDDDGIKTVLRRESPKSGQVQYYGPDGSVLDMDDCSEVVIKTQNVQFPKATVMFQGMSDGLWNSWGEFKTDPQGFSCGKSEDVIKLSNLEEENK